MRARTAHCDYYITILSLFAGGRGEKRIKRRVITVEKRTDPKTARDRVQHKRAALRAHVGR